MPAKYTQKERIRILKRVLERGDSVTKVCRESGISRVIFYRWLKQYKEQQELQKGKQNKLSPKKRLEIIDRVKAGESVSRVCELYGISRTLFYKWQDRYEKAPEGQKLEALWDQKPQIDRYYKQASEEYEEAVLAAVVQYPELSSHKLVWILPQIGGRPILGNHGVQNVLRRHDLNTYEQRLAFAQAYHKPTLSTHFFRSIVSLLTKLGSQQPGRRAFTVRVSFVAALSIFLGVVAYGTISLGQIILEAPSVIISIGMIFSLISLSVGMLFFLYSLKYYITIAIVLSYSRKNREYEQNYLSINENNLARRGIGLSTNIAAGSLSNSPFVSIHLATYNEKKVLDRLLTAATSQEYENYEVVLADDSTDETLEILKKWSSHPRVKIVHRDSREGYKGGALSKALEKTDPRAEFVIVFDADFIPYPDTITSFLKYFQHASGSLFAHAKGGKKGYLKSNVAAIQGYQWHVLNKSENWITRGVRSEYSGSYVIERSGEEVYGGLKQIAGSVYMIRADVLRSLGWGISITEDFELTLRLYEAGYKVIFTPYIQAPAEAVSTIKRLIRQRMRWAEGHSHNIKKMFTKLIFSPNLTKAEKFELLYLSPYYLQSFLFIVGTFSWFLAETVFGARLPFWTSTWGWSLVFTNLLALPLMNLVGLFLEESDEKDYLGLFSFVALSYISAPFQGYASVKGFLEKEEGPWFRTPKTGKITDVFTPGRLYKLIFGAFRKRDASVPSAAVVVPAVSFSPSVNQYLALVTANNQFDASFDAKPRRIAWIARTTLIFLLVFSISLLYTSRNIKLVYATNWTNPIVPTDQSSFDGTGPTFGANYISNNSNRATAAGVGFVVGNANASVGFSSNNYLFVTNLWPTGGGDAVLPSGNYLTQFAKSGNCACNAGNGNFNIGVQIILTNNDGTDQKALLTNWFRLRWNNPDNTLGTNGFIGNHVGNTIVNAKRNRLGLRFFLQNGGTGTITNTSFINVLINNSVATSKIILPATITVPEFTKKAVLLIVVIVTPLAPLVMMESRRRKYQKNLVRELNDDLTKLLANFFGKGEEILDDLPV